MPKELSAEEVREKLLQHLCSVITYWEREGGTRREALEGVMFSTLVALDGGSGGLPAFEVSPMPHESDKPYNIENGKDWYPEDGKDIGPLHEHFHAAMERSKKSKQ
jgi:hypothetical protein